MKKNKIKCGIAMSFYKAEHWLYTHHMRIFSKLCYRLIQLFFNCVIPPSVLIGKGTKIPHSVGIVIHHTAVIGENCTIYQNVTIGLPNVKIGNNVLIGANSVILGPISIGNNVKIGANTVVNTDIEDDCTVVGAKCRIIKRESVEGANN